MLIVSKFPGTCTACKGSISVGDRIQWEKGKGSSHVTCPKASTRPTVATRPSAAAPSSRWIEPDKALCPVQIVERRGWSKPDVDDRVGDFLRTAKNRPAHLHPNTVVAVVAQKRNYLSRDDAEDIAGPDDAGWSVVLYCRLATDAEKEAYEAKESEKTNRLAAEKKAKDDAAAQLKANETLLLARVDALKAGLVHVGEYTIPSGTDTPLGTTLSPKVQWVQRALPTGEIIVYSTVYSFDDYRQQWWGSRPLAEAAWMEWIRDVSMTPERAQEWLAKYKGCSGTEGYLFAASL